MDSQDKSENGIEIDRRDCTSCCVFLLVSTMILAGLAGIGSHSDTAILANIAFILACGLSAITIILGYHVLWNKSET